MHWFKVQKALRMIFKSYPIEDQKKPELFHYVRTLSYLYQNNYNEDVQLAWLLHDALEDTSITSEQIEVEFGLHVKGIVLANSKDLSVIKNQQLKDIVMRCIKHSQDALVVKMADVYDNFLYYVNDRNTSEIERCQIISWYISELKPKDWDDIIFDRLDEIHSYKI